MHTELRELGAHALGVTVRDCGVVSAQMNVPTGIEGAHRSVRCLRTYTSRRYLRSLTSAFQSMGPCMVVALDYRRKRPKSLLRRRLGSDWAGAVSCIDFGSVPRTPDAHCRQQLSVPVVRVLHSDHLCLQVSGSGINALICSACILTARHVSCISRISCTSI